MRAIEQIALKTADVHKRIKDIGPIYVFDGHDRREETKWVVDKVRAVNVYTHPLFHIGDVGSDFEVLLAFNYDVIPGRELELIQRLSGTSVQLMHGEPNEGLSHLGYHITDDAPLTVEVDWWNALGFVVAQISATCSHSATSKRYQYAFIDTRSQVGTFTKVISRVPFPEDIATLVDRYKHVNTIR